MKVHLVGDSIRINAEPCARARLDGLCVVSPKENCASSRDLRANLARWVPANRGDIVHLNCGLHDIRHDPGADGPVSRLDDYVANLRWIFAALENMQCRIIWATSTPVDEPRHNTRKPSRRYLADVIAYNEASVRLAGAFGFQVNDLYRQVTDAGTLDLLLPDGVHFNAAGNALVGRSIAEAIRQCIQRPAGGMPSGAGLQSR